MGCVARLHFCCSALCCSAVSTLPLTFPPLPDPQSFMFAGRIVWFCYFFLFVSKLFKLSPVVDMVLGLVVHAALTEAFVYVAVPTNLYPDVWTLSAGELQKQRICSAVESFSGVSLLHIL